MRGKCGTGEANFTRNHRRSDGASERRFLRKIATSGEYRTADEQRRQREKANDSGIREKNPEKQHEDGANRHRHLRPVQFRDLRGEVLRVGNHDFGKTVDGGEQELKQRKPDDFGFEKRFGFHFREN